MRTRNLLSIGLALALITQYSTAANYLYDALDRLIRLELEDGTVIEYSYDARGNRVSQVVTVPNKTPAANAGSDQTVRLGSLVRLSGSASSDPDNFPSPLTFSWAQASGPAVTLTGAATATPSFTANAKGLYQFSLVVSDGEVNSAPASVQITVPALGDIDLDGDVDNDDLKLITSSLNLPASGPNDPRDLDGDGKITVLDGRKLVTLCTRPRCATQ